MLESRAPSHDSGSLPSGRTAFRWSQEARLGGLGYPFRTMVVFAATLAIAVLFLVLPVGRGVAWTVAAVVAVLALLSIFVRTRQLARAHAQSEHVLAALGSSTADLPVSLRTRMPLVMVMGDALEQLFNRDGNHRGEEQLAHVGGGAIWLQVKRPQDLPRLAVAVKQWRDGRAPDGVVLSIAPALHAGEEALTQILRVVRQAVGDASRMLGTRLPGYVAVYQRLSAAPSRGDTSTDVPQWYGVSSATRLMDAQRFEQTMQAAEAEVQRSHGDLDPATPGVTAGAKGSATAAAVRAAGLASVIGWTQRVVVGVLADPRQPATPWALFGAGWIDCGPASNRVEAPWQAHLRSRSCLDPAPQCPLLPPRGRYRSR